jgi:hypothetical protein
MSEMAMRRAGIDPAVIYASLIVTEWNQHLLSVDDREDWIEAIFEYEGEAICLHLQRSSRPGAACRSRGGGEDLRRNG